MSTKRVVLGFGAIAVIAFFAMTFRPVPILPAHECEVVTGVVDEVREGTSHDVLIRLRDEDRRFYINRGLERGLELAPLQQLAGREVTLRYPEHWSPLDPTGSSVHVSVLEAQGEVLFDETPR